jgi:hypothetical protein
MKGMTVPPKCHDALLEVGVFVGLFQHVPNDIYNRQVITFNGAGA